MKLLRTLVLFVGFLSCSLQSIAQEGSPTDYTKEISIHDLSTVWLANEYLEVWLEDSSKRKRPEQLGFIGEDYQRFFIHFISAIKVEGKPYEYMVYGKTRVKNNICTFQGNITVQSAEVYKDDITQGYYAGIVTCNVTLYEDNKQDHSGTIKGSLKTWFMLNDKDYFGYSGLGGISDGFCNNQFTGTWTSYKNGTTKKCHWGEYRIPDCGDLDNGAAEFGLNEKYEKNGWENYENAWFGDPDNPETLKARKEETRQWWKD